MEKTWISSKIGEIANIQVARDLVEDHYSKFKTEKHKYPVYSNSVESRGLYGFYDFPEYLEHAVTVVGRGVGLGTAFARDKETPFGAIGRLIIVTPKNNSFDVVFFAEYINFCLKIHNESGGIPQLPGGSLSKYNVTLPPLPEQKKIAQILSTWDKAITTTERLIDLAHQQKKALMQQLLTGKKRLAGFEGEWANSSLKKLVTISKGQQLNRDTLDESGLFPVINGGITPSGYTDQGNYKANTITISEGGNSCGYVAFQKNEFWCGGHCYALTDLKLLVTYMYQLLKFNENRIMRLRVGSGLPNIQKKDLEALVVTFPVDSNEQKEIAKFLTTADQEIETLQSQLDGLKQEKKALMQALLTGKRRVQVAEV